MLRHWPQLVPNMSTDIGGHEALHHHHPPPPPHTPPTHGAVAPANTARPPNPKRWFMTSFLQPLPQFTSVHFRSRWYLCARKSPYALHPFSQKFPQARVYDILPPTTIQFSSVKDGIYALGKAHKRSSPSLRSFPRRWFFPHPSSKHCHNSL